MHQMKPCHRCGMVNVDPVTGDKTDEPLKSLSTFRSYTPEKGLDEQLVKERKKVLLGPLLALNCGIDSVGTVRVGDMVEII